jgi:hypothetical protein
MNTTMPASSEPFHDEARLRSAQHRVRNDLQTLFNLLLIAEKRMGVAELPIGEFRRWITGLSAAHDAMPVWKDDRPRLQDLIAALRSRVDAGNVVITEGGELTVRETSAVGIALAVSAILDDYRERTTPDDPIICCITAENANLHLQITRRSQSGPSPAWPPFSVVVAMEALRGTCEQYHQDGQLRTILIIPCR